jgi:hypothetical protein
LEDIFFIAAKSADGLLVALWNLRRNQVGFVTAAQYQRITGLTLDKAPAKNPLIAEIATLTDCAVRAVENHVMFTKVTRPPGVAL